MQPTVAIIAPQLPGTTLTARAYWEFQRLAPDAALLLSYPRRDSLPGIVSCFSLPDGPSGTAPNYRELWDRLRDGAFRTVVLHVGSGLYGPGILAMRAFITALSTRLFVALHGLGPGDAITVDLLGIAERVVVFSPEQVAFVRAIAPTAKVTQLPAECGLDYPAPVDRILARRSLGIPETSPLSITWPNDDASLVDLATHFSAADQIRVTNPDPFVVSLAHRVGVPLQGAASPASPTGVREADRAAVGSLRDLLALPEGNLPPVAWSGPVDDASGYAESVRQLVLGLNERRVAVHLDPARWSALDGGVEPRVAAQLESLQTPPPPGAVVVSQGIPGYLPVPPNGRTVARTMFETEGLPPGWANRLNAFTEIWVPSDLGRAAFTRAGVDPTKLRILPEGFDPAEFGLDGDVFPLPENLRGRYIFLSIFDWSPRKGADVLIRAFCRAFHESDPVALVIKTYSSAGVPGPEIQRDLRRLLSEFPAPPPVATITEVLPRNQVRALYRAASAFVLPTRGEGWGHPFMEALAFGLPVVAPDQGGHRAFLTPENSWLVRSRQVPVPPAALAAIPFYRGLHWVESDVDDFARALRTVWLEADAARRKAARGGLQIRDRYHRARIADQAARLLQRPDGLFVHWEGPLVAPSSLALVNRELPRALARETRSVLSITPWDFDLAEPDELLDAELRALVFRDPAAVPDITVRHAYPPTTDPRPLHGKFVVIQPWEFAAVPRTWIETLQSIDDLWVPSAFTRDAYVASGFPAEKVAIIPNGVDVERFSPLGSRLELPTTKQFRILFVGGTIWRKGIDLLLRAYVRAFSARDDVALIVKDMGVDSFYQGLNLREALERFSRDPSSPEIVYLPNALPPDQLPALYRACDCLVHPYRGEGFGLPIAEAMACGLPVAVTGTGATRDFCTPRNAVLLPWNDKLADPQSFVDPMDPVPYPEVDLDALVEALRFLKASPTVRSTIGRNGRETIVTHFTWQMAASRAFARMRELLAR